MFFFKLKLLFRILKRDFFNPDIVGLLKSIFQKRFQNYETLVFGKKFTANDSLSFLIMYEEILARQIYAFSASDQALRIVDCGANIGMSVLFFEKKYPNAQILAFEPDPNNVAILKKNLKANNSRNSTIFENAVWNKESLVRFSSYGAAGSRLEAESGEYEVKTVVLSHYLDQKTNFLKIDIEGAETEVLEEIKDKLQNVQNLFVEYHSFVGQPQKLSQILDILKAADFRFYIEHNGSVSQKPFIQISLLQEMDLCLNIYAYR